MINSRATTHGRWRTWLRLALSSYKYYICRYFLFLVFNYLLYTYTYF